MNINTAVGEIRTYYLNLPKDDLTEGGKFTGEVLEKLVATERAKVLSEVEEWINQLPDWQWRVTREALVAKLNQLKEEE